MYAHQGLDPCPLYTKTPSSMLLEWFGTPQRAAVFQGWLQFVFVVSTPKPKDLKSPHIKQLLCGICWLLSQGDNWAASWNIKILNQGLYFICNMLSAFWKNKVYNFISTILFLENVPQKPKANTQHTTPTPSSSVWAVKSYLVGILVALKEWWTQSNVNVLRKKQKLPGKQIFF